MNAPTTPYPLLRTINSPAELRALDRKQLNVLADELRQFLIESVSRTGGHLSSNLGTVELTIALHYIFNTPEDRIVWDVGHQTYGHKILTGRRERMGTLRQYKGLSGFPQRAESEFDTFGTAHSSTSISAALGMAVAARERGEERRAIAVIGDGALSAGMAFEALNNAGDMQDTNLLVVLNDNEMSISPPVGALTQILARLMPTYNAARSAGKRVLGVAPPMLDFARRVEEHVKGMVTPGTLFEEFGFNYIGPIDGHDLSALLPTLQNLRHQSGPQFLHVVTQKGQGYKLAEADPILYHGVSKFDHTQGIATGKSAGKLTYTQVFGDWLCDIAAIDERVVGITPAMREGSGLVRFAERFPSRYHDVGIAEQHAVTGAAGMAMGGLRPVVAVYSTFLNRAWDQVVYDVALHRLPVVFCLDRAGITGPDGASHHGVYDMALLSKVPGMRVLAPSSAEDLQVMLHDAIGLADEGPVVIRWPRGAAHHVGEHEVGVGLLARRTREGDGSVALLGVGKMLVEAEKAAAMLAERGIDATVWDVRSCQPLDPAMIADAARHRAVVTCEDGIREGGIGFAIADQVTALSCESRVKVLGIPAKFIPQGSAEKILAQMGLDAAGIVAAVDAALDA